MSDDRQSEPDFIDKKETDLYSTGRPSPVAESHPLKGTSLNCVHLFLVNQYYLGILSLVHLLLKSFFILSIFVLIIKRYLYCLSIILF